MLTTSLRSRGRAGALAVGLLAPLALLPACWRTPSAPAGTSSTAPAAARLVVPPGDTSRILRLRVPSRALAGNLLGDSATRTVLVYLPPDYATSGTKRYRSLYLLHGFGAARDGQNAWVGRYSGFHLGHSLDSLHAAGTVRDLIVVAPDAANFWGGSFYRDSPVAGGWATFITRELVRAIDATFRTIPRRDARGLAGHSMGGFGTLSLVAMHPDVYGAAYAMSPCCIAPDPSPGALTPVWKLIAEGRSVAAVRQTGFYGGAMMGLALAYSPNTAKPPLFVDAPFRLEGSALVPDTAVVRRWQARSPLRLLDSLSAGLRTLRDLGFDAGRSDNFRDIPMLVPKLDSMLTRKGVAHRTALYDGDHSNRIGSRMNTVVLPFFERALAK